MAKQRASLWWLVQAALGIWFVVLVVLWLVSDWPVVAVYPAMFAATFLVGAFVWWKYGYVGMALHGPKAIYAAAVIALVGVPLLFVMSARTDDHVYAHNAKGMAVWGGLYMLAAVLSLIGTAVILARTRREGSVTDHT